MLFCDPTSICSSEEKKVERRISRIIDKEIEKQKKHDQKEFKLLLLGTAEAGKSTVIKQMQVIHGNQFCDLEKRKEFIESIHKHVVESIRILLLHIENMVIKFSDADCEKISKRIKDQIRQEDYAVEQMPDLCSDIHRLWLDEGVQECYRRRHEFKFVYLGDSAKYFLDQVERVFLPDYVPSVEDILRVRKSTSAIHEYCFEIKHVYFRFVDVGGQKTERRKWVHCFDNVTAIVFISSLVEYDQYIIQPNPRDNEEKIVNRLSESLALFNVVIHEPSLQNAFIILFLNKTDIFSEKIQQRPLEEHFADFRDFVPHECSSKNKTRQKNVANAVDFQFKQYDVDRAQQFILQLFVNHVWDQFETAKNLTPIRKRVYEFSGPKMVYSHFTCATDTEAMKTVAESVEDNILRISLIRYNIT